MKNCCSRKDGGWLGIVKMLIGCAVVMIVLPYCARLALERMNGNDLDEQLSAAEKLQAMFGESRPSKDRLTEMLHKPLAKWNDLESKSMPAMHAWLKDHAKSVLPWEWTDTARAKDQEGYRRVWLSLYGDLGKSGRGEIRRLERSCKSWHAETEECRWLAGRITNQLARVKADLSTNGLPTIVRIDSFVKGRFWGYNHKSQNHTVASAKELQDFLLDESNRLSSCQSRISELMSLVAIAESRRSDIERILSSVDSSVQDLERMREDAGIHESNLSAPIIDWISLQ